VAVFPADSVPVVAHTVEDIDMLAHPPHMIVAVAVAADIPLDKVEVAVVAAGNRAAAMVGNMVVVAGDLPLMLRQRYPDLAALRLWVWTVRPVLRKLRPQPESKANYLLQSIRQGSVTT
jgi:hypothetical protein